MLFAPNTAMSGMMRSDVMISGSGKESCSILPTLCVCVCVRACVCHAGQWMEEEEERLTRSVLSAFKESAKTQLTDDHHVDMPPCDVALPGTKTWELVSSEVGTRNAQQCRHKW